MSLVNGVVASAVGGLVGALAWAGVSYAADYEIGWIAWGVGALAGYGMSLGLGGACDKSSGIVAALIALVSVFAGKYAAVHFAVHRSLAEATSSPIEDKSLVIRLADGVVEEWEAQGKPLTWPAGMTIEDAEGPADYPEGVWPEAQARFTAMSAPERERLRVELGEQRASALSAAESDFAVEGFMESLGPHDLLWGALAILTAFRLGSRPRGTASGTPTT